MSLVAARVTGNRNCLALLLGVVLLCIAVACGGGSNSNSNSNPPGTTPGSSGSPGPGSGGGTGSGSSTPAAKFVYALDSSMIGNPSIAGFTINTSTGALAQIAGSPFSIAAHKDTYAMAAIPATSFLFTVDWFDHTLETYRADPNTGALTLSTVLNTPELQNPITAITDQAGKFLFVGDALGLQIAVYAIASDGSLTAVPGSPFHTSQQPINQLTVNNAGTLLYAAGDNAVSGFTVGANGALTPVPGSPVTVRPPFFNPDKGPTGVGVVVDPAGRFLFVSDATSPQTWVYSIGSDGSLTLVQGSPFPTPGGLGVEAISPDGRFLFEGGGNQVAAFQVQSSGALVAAPGSPFPNGPFLSGGAPVSQLAVDPQGKFLLTSNIENSNITVFSIDANTGALTSVPGAPFPVAAKPIGGGSPSRIAITH